MMANFNRGKDFTFVEYPTFLFYIPYTAEQINSLEFLLLNQTQTETVYHSLIQLGDRPGIIRVTIPPKKEHSLAIDTTYYWRLNLDCQPDKTIAPDLVLQVWIERIVSNFQLENDLESARYADYLVYQQHDLWYDAIASLAQLHFDNPQNTRFTKAWNDLLNSLKLDWIIDEPLVDATLKAVEL